MANQKKKKKLLAYSIGAVMVLLLLPLFLNDHLLTVAITGFMWAYLCVCWNLVFGLSGQFSLGHMIFWGVGAYTSTILFVNYQVSPWIGALLGAVLAAVVACFMSSIILRYRIIGIYFALMTLAFAEVLRGLAMNWEYVRGPVGILLPLQQNPQNMLFMSRIPYYYLMLGLLFFGMLVTYLIKKSKMGYYLIAIREDEKAAEVAGVPTSRYKINIMVISAFLTALAGTFYAQFFLYITPDIMLGFGCQMNMLIGTMVGGPGTIFGPVLGSLVFSFLGELLRGLPFAHSREIMVVEQMIWALLLIIVIMRLPGGIITLLGKGKSTFKKDRNDSEEGGDFLSN